MQTDEGTLELTADSGTEVHVIPFRFVTKFMKWIRGPEMTMRGASGEELKHYGRVEILLRVNNNIIKLHMEVVDARRALLSVSMMIDLGWSVRFEGTESVIQLQDFCVEVEQERRTLCTRGTSTGCSASTEFTRVDGDAG